MRMQLSIPLEPLKEKGVLDRMRGREPAQHAYAHAKNLVITGDFSADAIRKLEGESGIDLAMEFAAEWDALLEEVAFQLGKDCRYEADERAFVAEVVKAFRVSRARAELALGRASARIFAHILVGRIEGDTLSEKDVADLDAIARKLGLSEDGKVKAMVATLKARVEQSLGNALADGMVSDAEWESFLALCRNLRVNISNLGELEQAVALARDRWRVLHGTMTPSPCPDLKLGKDESVYFRGPAEWYEYRKVRQRIDYGGFSGRIRIAKGLSFRYGSVAYRAPSVDELLLIATGDLVLTNKRALFLSAKGANKSIPWRSVVRVSMNSHNEFVLEKATGKSPVLNVTGATVGHRFLCAFVAERLLENWASA